MFVVSLPVSLPFLPGKTLSCLFLTILFPGNVARLPVSVVYDVYQKIKVRKRHLYYTPPLRLARAALSANGLSSISSTSAEIFPNCDLLVDAYRKLTGEVFLLRSQVLGYICVQAIRAQLYGMIGGRRRVV